jgi:ABC-type branched-subunit amino acid transport system ATPase component
MKPLPTMKPLPGVPVTRALPIRSIKKEVTIAVMGLTGTGKSSFIKTATGDARIHVGDTLDAGACLKPRERVNLLTTRQEPMILKVTW